MRSLPVEQVIGDVVFSLLSPLPARGQGPRALPDRASGAQVPLVTRSLDPTGTGRARWAMRWKPVLNAFAMTFGDRFPAAETY
jgi:hypothetical protein